MEFMMTKVRHLLSWHCSSSEVAMIGYNVAGMKNGTGYDPVPLSILYTKASRYRMCPNHLASLG